MERKKKVGGMRLWEWSKLLVLFIYLFIPQWENRERERESEIKLGFLAGGGENAREEHLAFLFVCFFFFFLFFFLRMFPLTQDSREGEKKRESWKGGTLKMERKDSC